MSKSLIVITGVELGWDCVLGVYSGEEAVLDSWLNQELEPPFTDFKELVESFNGEYVLHYETLDDYPVA